MGKRQVGRIAMREEGNYWNAYYALPDTMEGALYLGGIAIAAVQDPERRRAFVALIQDAIGEVLKEAAGEDPQWRIEPAPEHERAGRA